jgi:hypothetical protein
MRPHRNATKINGTKAVLAMNIIAANVAHAANQSTEAMKSSA